MTRLRSLSALLLCAGLAACNNAAPVLLPPPFGPGHPRPTRLFFPTGLAVAPQAAGGHLLVANGNFDRAFDYGTLVSIDSAYIAAAFADASGVVDQQIPEAAFLGKVMIGNYAGPLALDAPGTTAYTGSRDSSRLNAARLAADGTLSCVGGGTDCTAGVIDLNKATALEGPYGIANGFARQPGETADRPVIFVSELIPHIDQIVNGTAFTSARVAAVDQSNPTSLLFSMLVSNPVSGGGGIGAGPLIFDGSRRQLVLGGCFARFPNSSQGDPTTGKCGNRFSNLIRFVSVDAGASAEPRVFDIAGDVHGTEVSGFALGGADASGVPQILYATIRNPDLIAEIVLPNDPALSPTVRRATPLPLAPEQVLHIARPDTAPGADLLAVSAAASGTVDIYDASAGQVVAQIENLGDTPFSLAQIPPVSGDAAARLVVTVFGDCRLGLIEARYDQPWKATLKKRLGSCPP